MRNNLLQRVNDGDGKPGSIKGPAVIFYIVSLVVAFLAGGYYERVKMPVPTRATGDVTAEAIAVSTPAEMATPAPIATAAPTARFSPPPLITSEPSSTPVRIEKAIAVAPSTPAPAATVAAIATPAPVAASTPAKQPGSVTVTEPVTDIPVKDAGKIVGYINLQPGAQIVPLSVENGQIKFKSGDRFAYVPVKSTDMQH